MVTWITVTVSRGLTWTFTEHHLCREADVFEGFILAPAAEDVGNGGKRVLVHGCGVPGLFKQYAAEAGDGKSQDAVHKHQELRVCESFAIFPIFISSIGTRHHSLLQHAPCQIRDL